MKERRRKQINWHYITPRHELEWLLCGFILAVVNIVGVVLVSYMFPW